MSKLRRTWINNLEVVNPGWMSFPDESLFITWVLFLRQPYLSILLSYSDPNLGNSCNMQYLVSDEKCCLILQNHALFCLWERQRSYFAMGEQETHDFLANFALILQALARNCTSCQDSCQESNRWAHRWIKIVYTVSCQSSCKEEIGKTHSFFTSESQRLSFRFFPVTLSTIFKQNCVLPAWNLFLLVYQAMIMRQLWENCVTP